jgi:hypothetical protein
MATTTTIKWEGRTIRLSYTPRYFASVDHVEVEALDGQPLPITDTGYRSHFFGPVVPALSLEEVRVMVIAMLDEAAAGKKWQDYLELSKQLSLF